MAELNPYQRNAHTVAFLCYVLSGLVLLAGIFFTLGAATADLPQLGLKSVTNLQMAALTVFLFITVAFMIILFGLRVQRLLGQQRLPEKVVARSAVGCLRLGSLGCFLWALLSAVITAVSGKMLATGEPAGLSDILAGASGLFLVIVVLQAVAWYIATNYARLKPDEIDRILVQYMNNMRLRLNRIAEPETLAYMQEETLEVLTKLDTRSKGTLLSFLGESGLLTGNARVSLQGADFSRVVLHSISLPRADLRGINLEKASLVNASLYGANLQKARLKEADLQRAYLEKADLRQADLTNADLEDAKLKNANLTGAINARLERVHLEETVQPDGKLSGRPP